jgi:hypothetical protein
MSDFETIQTLIRLKRHEQPSPEFLEEFVRSFKERQRAEMLNQSARGLLWERVTTYFDGIFAPKWALAGATAVAMLGTVMLFRPVEQGAGGGLVQTGSSFDVRGFDTGGRLMPISDEEVRQYLLSRHYQGGFADEREGRLLAHDPQMTLNPVGFRLDVEY